MEDDHNSKGETQNLDITSTGRFMQERGTGPLDNRLPWVIEFRVVGSASIIQTQLKPVMVLGREDPEHNVFPEIDLTPYHAYTHGVSRRHAVILVHSGRITVKDLDSTNGTRLNDFDLMPGQEYRLRHGDELSIGQLKLQVMFTVVPAHEDTAPESNATGEPVIPHIGQGQHIMIVEDDDDVAAVFRMALEKAGFRTQIVKSAVDAVSEVSQRMPDAIVLDLMLPDLSGLDFVRYVRKNSERHVPMVVVSGATGGFQQSKVMDAGADIFLGKPVSIEELVRAVSGTLAGTPQAE